MFKYPAFIIFFIIIFFLNNGSKNVFIITI